MHVQTHGRKHFTPMSHTEKEATMKYCTSQLLTSHGFSHLFATRHGGVSTHPEFASLNVSFSRKNSEGMTDSAQNVFENYKIILGELGISPEYAVNATQVHSDIILSPNCKDGGRGIDPSLGFMPDCDGVLITAETEIRAACVKTADCTPILFANNATGAVCAVHAGWRGTVADISGRAVEKLLATGGTCADIIAAIGPCIGKCCYEVSRDVKDAAQAILGKGGKSAEEFFTEVHGKDGKYMADLAGLNRYLICRRGVPDGNVDILNLCTSCHTDAGKHDFFSHRASGGHSGTQLSVILRR